jgi:hypothetical protein
MWRELWIVQPLTSPPHRWLGFFPRNRQEALLSPLRLFCSVPMCVANSETHGDREKSNSLQRQEGRVERRLAGSGPREVKHFLWQKNVRQQSEWRERQGEEAEGRA